MSESKTFGTELANKALKKAKCDSCALGEWHRRHGSFRPVPAELRAADVLVVSRSPEASDLELRRPLTSYTGRTTMEAFETVGKGRKDAGWTCVVACPYPRNDSQAFVGEYRKMCADGSKWLMPEQACRPRLAYEAKQYKAVLTLGPEAAKALLGNIKLSDYRGAPHLTPGGKKLLCTFNPSVLRTRGALRPYFFEDVKRAFRYFANALDWVDPVIEYCPSAESIRAYGKLWTDRHVSGERGKPVCYDHETSMDRMDAGQLHCTGVASPSEGFVVFFKSRETGRNLLTTDHCYHKVNWQPREGQQHKRRQIGHSDVGVTRFFGNLQEITDALREILEQKDEHEF